MKRGYKNSHRDLSAKFIKQILHYAPQTGQFTRISRTGSKKRITGCFTDRGYVRIRIGQNKYYVHRLAWLYMTNHWPKHEIDHANGKAADNRWNNLREATASQNMRNRKINKNNMACAKGVTWDVAAKKWRARINLYGRTYWLGYFSRPNEARKAYNKAAHKLHGLKWAKTT